MSLTFRLVLFLMVIVVVVWAAKADSPTLREIDRLNHRTDFRGIHDWDLRVFCDAPRGNVVYLADPVHSSDAPTIAVIHQPDVCK